MEWIPRDREVKFHFFPNIALCSSGPGDGKTTLACYLASEYGYIHANHSRTLWEMFARDTPDFQWEDLQTPERKEYWRPHIQAYAKKIGYSTDTQMITHTLLKSGWYPLVEGLRTDPLKRQPPVVIEAIRTREQAKYLADMGFYIVKINLTTSQRRARFPLTWRQIEESMQHEVERPLPDYEVDMVLAGALSTPMSAKIIIDHPFTGWPKLALKSLT